MQIVSIQTADGVFTARFSERGLAALEFPDSESGRTGRNGECRDVTVWVEQTACALTRLLEGKPAKVLPPLDLSGGTPFQQCVWRALREVPLGATTTYSEVARQIGQPAGVRAVGGACGANTIPVIVPCHRVLLKGGGLGGFSAGLRWKRVLLSREGLQLPLG